MNQPFPLSPQQIIAYAQVRRLMRAHALLEPAIECPGPLLRLLTRLRAR